LSFSVDASIIAQVSGKIAGDLVVAGIVPLAEMGDVQRDIFNTTLSLAGAESVVEVIESVGTGARGNRGGGNSGGNRGRSSNGDGGQYANQAPGDVVIKSGKHEGKTIADAAAEDPEWIEWARENLNNDFLRKKVEAFASAA
jgi:hypothetical protein